ncbi:hypothetical protein F4779DRAFT_577742 [Xylariaceae sp. FL0662B]|nr:hypothetical protein F4779DRAFT_577742 [Xylariaceae sp. FL0662B]
MDGNAHSSLLGTIGILCQPRETDMGNRLPKSSSHQQRGQIKHHVYQNNSSPYTPEAWERRKEDIRRLYLDEDKTLKEVILVMRSRGFKATPRMYKRKFVQWGFVKRNTTKDVAVMIALQRQRATQGKRTIFKRHGRAIDITSYVGKKGASSLELIKLSDGNTLPEYLEVLTPTSPKPEFMTLPAHLHAQESLVSYLRNIMLSWMDASSREAFTEASSLYMGSEARQAIRDFGDACRLSRQYNPHSALLSQRAFGSLHLLVKAPSAQGIIDLLISIVASPDHGLTIALWKYLAAYARLVEPTSALCRLFTALDEEVRYSSPDFCVNFISSCIDTILRVLLDNGRSGSALAYSISFFLLCDLYRFRATNRPISSLGRVISTTVALDNSIINNCFDVNEPLHIALHMWQRGQYDERVAQCAFATVRAVKEPTEQNEWKAYYSSWRLLAFFHRSQCSDISIRRHPRHDLARYALKRAIDAAEVFHPEKSLHLKDMQILEDWYREAGDVAQAAVMRKKREKVLNDYLLVLQQNQDLRSENGQLDHDWNSINITEFRRLSFLSKCLDKSYLVVSAYWKLLKLSGAGGQGLVRVT